MKPEVILDIVESILLLTNVGGDRATTALRTVRAGLTALKEGLEGKTDPDLVLEQIKSLHQLLAGNDAAADALLEKDDGA